MFNSYNHHISVVRVTIEYLKCMIPHKLGRSGLNPLCADCTFISVWSADTEAVELKPLFLLQTKTACVYVFTLFQNIKFISDVITDICSTGGIFIWIILRIKS